MRKGDNGNPITRGKKKKNTHRHSPVDGNCFNKDSVAYVSAPSNDNDGHDRCLGAPLLPHPRVSSYTVFKDPQHKVSEELIIYHASLETFLIYPNTAAVAFKGNQDA